MSYGRNPHYIWSDGERMYFNMNPIPENEINALLYKLLLTGRRKELSKRLREGKKEWMTQYQMSENMVCTYIEQDASYVKWMEDEEDDLLKQLMESNKS